MWPFGKSRQTPDLPERANDPGVPLASVLVRSMDRGTLDRALRSAAAQTWGNVEIVVVAACGARHRSLPDSLGGRPLRLVRADDGGTLDRPQAANHALREARGEWLNFLDDDDEWLPDHLQTLLGAPRHGGEKLVHSIARVVDTRGRPMHQVGGPGEHLQLWFHSRAAMAAMAFHRSLVEAGAAFDPRFPVHEDHDFQIACATRTAFAFVDATTCVWHACIGESGCGFGNNENPALRADATLRLREKWRDAFARWLRKPDALLRAGKRYFECGDLAPALECLERAIALRPDDANALNLCALAHAHAGDAAHAEVLLRKALKRAPRHAAARANLARLRAQHTPPGE